MTPEEYARDIVSTIDQLLMQDDFDEAVLIAKRAIVRAIQDDRTSLQVGDDLGDDRWVAPEEPTEDMIDDGCYSVETAVPDPDNGDLYHPDRGWTAEMAGADLKARFIAMRDAAKDKS